MLVIKNLIRSSRKMFDSPISMEFFYSIVVCIHGTNFSHVMSLKWSKLDNKTMKSMLRCLFHSIFVVQNRNKNVQPDLIQKIPTQNSTNGFG